MDCYLDLVDWCKRRAEELFEVVPSPKSSFFASNGVSDSGIQNDGLFECLYIWSVNIGDGGGDLDFVVLELMASSNKQEME